MDPPEIRSENHTLSLIAKSNDQANSFLRISDEMQERNATAHELVQEPILLSSHGQTDVDLIKKRLELLIFQNSPLDASKLTNIYFEAYNESLDLSRFGSGTLKSFLDFLASLPFLEITNSPNVVLLCYRGKERVIFRPDLKTVVRNVETLVKQHSPLDASFLPEVYKESFGRSLNYKIHGCRKLKNLLQLSDSIEMRFQASGTPLLLQWRETENTFTEDVTALSFSEKGKDDNALGEFQCQKKAVTLSSQEQQNGRDGGKAFMEYPWLREAVDLWVSRALKASQRINADQNGAPLPVENFEYRLSTEAKKSKKLRPNGVPDERVYVKQTIKVLRKDPRLRCEKGSKGYVYWPAGVSNEECSSTDSVYSSQEWAPDFMDGKPKSLESSPAEANLLDVVSLASVSRATPSQSCFLDGIEAQSKANEVETSLLNKVRSYFLETGLQDTHEDTRGVSIADKDAADSFKEAGLLGRLRLEEKHCPVSETTSVFMNTHEPFCLATVGVQGAGKSHSLACVLENCLLSFKTGNISTLKKPMTALVLHYDQNTTSICEAAGLLSPAKDLQENLDNKLPEPCCVPTSKAVVLVSPTYYRQRKSFYGDHCTVRPLLFKWGTLSADHIKRIMRIGSSDNQLYIASCMTLLRKYQRANVVPDFANFLHEIKEICNVQGQQGPLSQRIALLESVIAESEVNNDIFGESLDVCQACKEGLNLIIADLTDPLLSKEEANGLFQVLTEQFRSIPIKGGKLLALDEAHKFMTGDDTDGLSEAIVNVARLMRHDGMRLAVSTQSPKALAPELLELVSVAILHQFHSQDWWTYLRRKMPLPDSAWEDILSLRSGNAMVFASRYSFSLLKSKHEKGDAAFAGRLVPVRIRPRLTQDFGASRTNN